ncbi:GFA family protein [Halobacteriovorax sp. GB3]|uniref:GFA family protein n=1 Tax=Halobacteriovorax sp. GB3 TaxID=2719615 RepID=UPI002361D81F|nr:GFA family protein [Halobacteriovorax sp. GB3]MDD0853618.1 GFA family protein [Halobacteriovorax sp. GB3]
MSYFGSCLCGDIKFEVTEKFLSFYLCHCKYCQKDTGSAHAANLFTKHTALKWLSGEESVRKYQVPSSRHAKSFCQNCGSAVATIQEEEQLLVVPAGSLDGPVEIRPNAHLFISSKANWDDQLHQIESFDKFPE